jgi:hypothetical protein
MAGDPQAAQQFRYCALSRKSHFFMLFERMSGGLRAAGPLNAPTTL